MSFMMTVHTDQYDPNYKHSHMAYRACVQIPRDVDYIDSSMHTQMLKTPQDLLVQLAALENVRNQEIGTLNKERGDIFSECCTDSFRGKFL